jgi:hypothetical protein
MKIIYLSDEDAKYLYDNIDSWYDESAVDGDGITDWWHSDRLNQLHNIIKDEIMSQDNALINANANVHNAPLTVGEIVPLENVKPIDREELRKLLAEIIDVVNRIVGAL